MKNLLITLFFLSAFYIKAQDNPSLDVSNIPSELKINSNAVLRLQEDNIIIESHDDMTWNSRRVVTIFNENGNYLSRAAGWYDKYREIKKIQAIIYDDKGNEIKKIRRKDFVDHSAVDGGTLYSDSRVLYMNYKPYTYPYTIDFTVEYETPNTASIHTWRPVDNYNMGIEESKFSVIDNANLGLRFKEKNFDGFAIESNKEANSITYSIKNVPAYIREDLSPSLTMVLPKVMVAVSKFHYNGVDGEASNWQEFGNWVDQALLKGRDQVSLETQNEVKRLTEGVEDPLEKAKIVYNYVQSNTRYISVQVGIGGIQPIAAIDVDQLKYGDCKGLTNYTQSLLKVVGVESYYSVVEAGQEIEDFDEEFPTLEQGNHIILAIPNGEEMIWLDCTSQVNPFGFIGDFTDNRNVLMVKPNDSKIVKTTNYVNSDNSQIITSEIKVNEDASITAQLVIKTRGIQYDNKFFIERESKENIEKFYRSYWGYINGININNFEFSNNKDEVEFTETLTVSAKDYASINDNRLIFKPNFFDRNQFIPDRYRNRRLPFSVSRGYQDEDVFSIEIPEGYEVESAPSDTEIKNRFGVYESKIKVTGNKITYTRKLQINKGSYSKSDYGEYRDFRKDVSKQDSSIISLLKKN